MKHDGTGNLDNEAGYRLIDRVLRDLKQGILYELNGNEYPGDTFVIIAQMDLITFLAEHYETYPRVSLEIYHQWRKKVLELWSEQGEGGWLDERREVMVETMDKLEALIRRHTPAPKSSAETTSE